MERTELDWGERQQTVFFHKSNRSIDEDMEEAKQRLMKWATLGSEYKAKVLNLRNVIKPNCDFLEIVGEITSEAFTPRNYRSWYESYGHKLSDEDEKKFIADYNNQMAE